MRTLTYILIGAASCIVAGTTGCSGDDCEKKLTCAPSTSTSTSTSTSASGGMGGTPATGGGGQGGAPDTCGNNVVDVGEICFQGAVEYPTNGQGSIAIAATDCDGDGDIDLLVPNYNSMDFTALRNNGSGQFLTTVATTTYLPPTSITTGYFFLGGRDHAVAVGHIGGVFTDLFDVGDNCSYEFVQSFAHAGVVNQPTFVATAPLDNPVTLEDVVVLAGDTMITIVNHSPSMELYSGGSATSGLSMLDINMDDVPDAIYVDTIANTLLGKINGGPGSLSPQTTQLALTSAAPIDTAVGDIDNDGDDDIIVVNQGADSVTVFRNDSVANGAVEFTRIVPDVSLAGATGPRAAAIADIDYDGDLDIVTVNFDQIAMTGTVSILTNNGNGIFTAAARQLSTSDPCRDIVLADFNQDGAVDIAVVSLTIRNMTSHVHVFHSDP